MSLETLPNIATIPQASPSFHTHLLDHLFEPSPAIHTLLLPVLTLPHSSYPSLLQACRARLLSLANSTGIQQRDSTTTTTISPELLSVLGSHPRLGEKKIDSAASREEQQQLQAGKPGETEGEQLAGLNAEYEAAFPGLRFVSFVNGRSRGVIMEEMRERIDRGDFQKEVDAALQAMCDIAEDRASKLLKKSGGE